MIKKQQFGFYPTPLHELKNLSDYLKGPRIFIKRDDLTGLAFGGNKTRKLEYLIGHALEQGCDTVITGGAEQSNHCRQTAAAAAASGIECVLVLGGEEPEEIKANLLLDKILKAKIYWTGEFRKGEKIPDITQRLADEGYKPYVIPYGGSNEIGALGFVNALWEVKIQARESKIDFSTIVFASSSGGTHAGLIVGNYIFEGNYTLVGIGIDKEELPEGPLNKIIAMLACSTSNYIGFDYNIPLEDIIIKENYFGEGYGVLSEMDKEAITLMAQKEGIFLDPVYSGRAMAGLIDMIRREEIGKNENILFWHTGGTPALFNNSQGLL